MFDSKYFLIINYPRGASGKFLANCLGISDGATLQHKDLINLTSKQKVSLLLDRLESRRHYWDDLDLGDSQLFEMGCFTHDVAESYSIETKQAIDNKKYVMRIVHNPYHVSNLLNTWHNAKVIDFVDCDSYLKHRPNFNPDSDQVWLQRHWDDIRDKSWPIDPPEYVEDIPNLPEHIQNDIKKIFRSEIIELLKNKNPIPKSTITWNPNWFLDKNTFLEKLFNLYNILELNDFNEELIITFYNKYIEVAQISK